MKKDFYPKMKVYLNGEYGVVLDKFREWDGVFIVNGKEHKGVQSKNYGIIRWDTNGEINTEDWIGLYGSFIDAGGKEISQAHNFKFIDDMGKLLK